MPKKSLTAAEKRYRQYLRTLPCYACAIEDETIVGHHLTFINCAMGSKAGEEFQIPLCFTCHIEKLHRHGERSFWEGLGISLDKVTKDAVETYRDYHW